MTKIKNIKNLIKFYYIALACLIITILVASCNSSGGGDSNSSSVGKSDASPGGSDTNPKGPSTRPGGTVTKPGITVIPAVAAGDSYSLYLKNDGTVWSFGKNNVGQLGLGTTTPDAKFPTKLTSIKDASAVAAGTRHSLVLKTDGTLWAFGMNNVGQLGFGNNDNTSTALQATGDVSSGVQAISAGRDFSLVLKNDGTLLAFGNNDAGQLGIGSINNMNRAVQVAGDISSGVKAISAGDAHALILKTDNTVWAIGYNNVGQLGQGDIDNTRYSTTAVPITGEAYENAKAVAAGYDHSIVLKNDGTVWIFGNNDSFQLGLKNQRDVANTRILKIPTKIIDLSNDVLAIAAGTSNTLVLKNSGSIFVFGLNANGQLGLTSTFSTPVPVDIIQFKDNVQSIDIGTNHSLLIKKDGSIWAFGSNSNGQIGAVINKNQDLNPTMVEIP